MKRFVSQQLLISRVFRTTIDFGEKDLLASISVGSVSMPGDNAT
jgi:hypothetical protein